jgi:hypothetical protein
VTLATSFALATPSIRLGGRGTSVLGSSYAGWNDSLGEITRITYEDAYAGVGIEAVYGPISWAYGRAELAAVRSFFAGGGALIVFPTTGLDVLVEPQFQWRVLPYVWGGGSYAGYWGKQDNADPRFSVRSLYELRAGIGVEYRLSPRVNLFAEIQVLSTLSALFPGPPRGSGQGVLFKSYGVERADVGFRYDFGAK